MRSNIEHFSKRVEQYLSYTEQPWGKLFYTSTLAQIEPFLASDDYVVDVGCGFGITIRSLADKGWRVLGLEPNNDLLSAAKQKAFESNGIIEFKQAAIEDLHPLAFSADFLLCHNVLEYLDDPEKGIWTLAQNITRQGYLSLITHNPLANVMKKAIVEKSPSAALSFVDRKTDYSSVIGADISLFSQDDLNKWLTKAGFQVIERYGIHNLYSYIDNEHKFDDEWNQKMTELEMKVCSVSPYRDIAVFSHTIARLL
ncbi:class I SAM-dependent methyltransferase [Priestia koreensis]|uniref:class I SAM-dependent methyltransferase n=1 Tax=Priestia koreensis TaxID=284581 RepID=UPI003CFE836C